MPMPQLRIQIYADGANKDDMVRRYNEGFVKGFTTNPTLMAKAGITDYEGFAKSVLATVKEMPISFEVFSDDFTDMKRQALKIAAWAPNVNVKIPITNTKGESALPLVRELLGLGLKLNVTAIFTQEQLHGLREVMKPQDDVIVSVFAGRIADSGVDPVPLMTKTVQLFKELPKAKVLWASPREVLNVYQADQCGCHIITITDDLLKKLNFYRKDLGQFSLETVQMFYDDATKSKFTL